MEKLAVFDLDGTLLDTEGRLPEANRHAVQRLMRNGYGVTIATGRHEHLMRHYVRALELTLPVITCNGAVVGHCGSGAKIRATTIAPQTVKAITAHCEANGHDVMAYTPDAIYSEVNARVRAFEAGNAELHPDDRVRFAIGLKHMPPQSVHKLLIIEQDAVKYRQLRAYLDALDGLEVVQSNSGYIDVMQAGSTKRTGVALLAACLKLQSRQIVAFGDQDNDVDMLRYAGFAVGMGNATAPVKAVVDFVTTTNGADGIPRAVDYLLGGHI